MSDQRITPALRLRGWGGSDASERWQVSARFSPIRAEDKTDMLALARLSSARDRSGTLLVPDRPHHTGKRAALRLLQFCSI